jgi:hypothetical protein
VFNRRTLLQRANQAAVDARSAAGLDLTAPIDVYELAERLEARVLFLDVSMEGFYQKGPPARILLSAKRPLARRAFTCAHELGHHWFGHGSRIDELKADERHQSDIPEEVLANGFASFLLMPSIGLRSAFNGRGWSIDTADPMQMLTIATEFGVGYTTLLTHLAISLRDLPYERREELERWTPQRIRQHLLGDDEFTGLAIVDAHSEAKSVDLEIGYGLTVPSGTVVEGAALKQLRSAPMFDVYEAVKRGRSTLTVTGRKIEARVAPASFVGRANYRFLEDPDE